MTIEGRVQLTTGPSLAEQAYGVIRDLIATGELAPGERLTERALADRLGVSPTPVREAISRLIHERLLVRVGGRALQVADSDARNLHDMALIAAALNGVAARLAAESASDEELQEISRADHASREMSKRDRDVSQEAAELRHDFHHLVVQASHNPSLINMIATADAFGRPLRLQAQRSPGAVENIRRAVDEHEAIVAALLARDGARAEELMREHTAWVGARYLDFAEARGLPPR
jgi:DNA-binding GntR family transcriptional regulator